MGVSAPIDIDMEADSEPDANGEKLGDAAADAKYLLLLLAPTPPRPPPLAKEAPIVMSTLKGVIAEVAFNWMELSSRLMAVLES